jgi:hypothetical protein
MFGKVVTIINTSLVKAASHTYPKKRPPFIKPHLFGTDADSETEWDSHGIVDVL